MVKRLIIFITLIIGLASCDLGRATPPPPPSPTPRPTATPMPEASSVAGFDDFLAKADPMRFSDRAFLANQYWAQLDETPLVAGNRAVFVWRGSAQRVVLAGDMNGWDPDSAEPLNHLDGTELWWVSLTFEPNARLDYKFVADGSRWMLDELNPNQVLGGFGLNSELRMPEYHLPAELEPPTSAVPAGTLTTHAIDSRYFESQRTAVVYQPAAQLVGQPYPSLYVHDGGDYINLAGATAILDRLIHERTIPPLVVVFIPPIDRVAEYHQGEAYTHFIVEELLPFVREKYNTDSDPARTGTLGASSGGVIAAHLGLTQPQHFGLVAGHSGAYFVNENALVKLAANADTAVRFHLVVGSYDKEIYASNEEFAAALDKNGNDYELLMVPQGHSWGLWRDYFGASLRYLFP